MGICGTAMGSLAGILHSMGFKITGSDRNVYPPMSTQLQELGIEIRPDYRPENLVPRPDFVIVGNVISKNFPEAEALLKSDIPYTSLPQALGSFVIGDRQSLVVAGTHGKTTTTALVAFIAEICGLEPGFLIGGIPINFPRSFRAPGSSSYFVIEGDEYDTAFFDKRPKFVHYRPTAAILTSIEFDHADIYGSLEDVMKSFRSLMELMPSHGLLVVNGEDPNILSLLKSCPPKCRVVSYGMEEGDYTCGSRRMEMGRNQFSILLHGESVGEGATKLFGAHNTMNSLAAFALARELGWPLYRILQGLADFKGVKRRQEIIGEPGGIVVVEDFAHHPTAVRVTIDSIHERFPGQKVFAVFEPRSATSRRKFFQKDYVEAFLGAEEVLISKPFDQDKISEGDRFSSGELVEDLKKRKSLAEAFSNPQEIISYLKARSKKGDVILIMSNGAFGGIYGPLLEALRP